MLNKSQIDYCLNEMEKMFPDAHCELYHRNPFDLVIAVLLSAQCTDALVNKVTKTLFEKYQAAGRLFEGKPGGACSRISGR